jgi:ankyrin repeat protein
MLEKFLLFIFKKRLAGEGIVKFFIKGINPDFKDEEGKTLFHWAVYSNNLENVRLLLENGAHIDAKDKDGMTPLYWSLNWWNIDKEITKFLISRGADIHTRDYNNTSLLHMAENRYIVKLLISKGLDVNLKDNNGNTPLQFAENKSIAELLISAGADVKVKNNDGETPLHSATEFDCLSLIKFLISSGSDINAIDNDGDTPLHLAVSNESPEIVEFLISAGADLTIKNNEGETPHEFAKKYVDVSDEYNDILKLFTEKKIKKETAPELPSDTKINMETLPGNKLNIHINNTLPGNKLNIHINNTLVKDNLVKSLMSRIGFSTFVFTLWAFFLYSFIIGLFEKFEPVNLLFIFIWIYIAIRFLFPWFIRVLTSFFGKVSIEIEKTSILLCIKWIGLYSTEKVIPIDEIDNFEMLYDTSKDDNRCYMLPYSVTINCNIKKIELPVYLSEMETKWLYNKLMELL